MPRHEIDPANQGMLMPRAASSVAVGAVIEHEGVFYQRPEITLSPEQTEVIARLQAEHDTLDSFALENRGAGNIFHKSEKLNTIEADPRYPEENKDAIITDLNASIHKSETSKPGLKVGAKGSFAKSIGIEVRTDIVAGDPVILTKDPQQQAKLDDEYKAFRAEYFGTRKFKHLDHRRKQIKQEIAATRNSAQN